MQDELRDFLTRVVGGEALIEIRRGDGRQAFLEGAGAAADYVLQELQADLNSERDLGKGDRFWYGVAARVPGQGGGRDGCYPPRVFFVDFDDMREWVGEEVQSLLAECLLPAPSLVVRSGGGFHCYWLLSNQDLLMSDWENRQRNIVERLYSWSERMSKPWTVDRACRDVSRVLQVPFVPNFKYPERPIARLCEDLGTEETYDINAFIPQEVAVRSDWWDLNLPARIEGVGPACNSGYGGLNNTIWAFACHHLVRQNANINDVYSLARARFCDQSNCDPAVPWHEVQEIVTRAHHINQTNRAAAEREGRNLPGPGRPAERRPQIPSVRTVATRIVAEMGGNIKHVSGRGPMIYEPNSGRYMGDVYVRSAVRGELERLYENVVYSHYSSGSGFTALMEEVSSLAERVENSHGREGEIPLSGPFVLRLTGRAARILNAADDPPVTDWASPASPEALEDRISKKDYGAWMEFLKGSFPNPEERDYLGRLAYYMACGGNPERVFIMAYGPTSSGKNLFFECLSYALQGTLAVPDRGLVSTARFQFDATTHMCIAGKRLVFLDEINKGTELDLARVKALTSDAGIMARAAYQREAVSVPNTFVLALLSNDLPEIRNNDEAFLARLHFIPFSVSRRHPTIRWRENDNRPVMDLTLKKRIKPEEVLAWVVSYKDDYEEHGITPPIDFIEEAQRWYRISGPVAEWADGALKFMSGVRTSGADIFHRYERDCGKGEISKRKLYDDLLSWAERVGMDVVKVRGEGGVSFLNLAFSDEE